MDDLETFFNSGRDVLCPWHSHLDLPEFVQQGILSLGQPEGTSYDLSGFGRLVIYTDGTSKTHERRKPPLRVEEQGTPDAWAFAVLGENCPTHTQSGSLTFLGWHSQRVRYTTVTACSSLAQSRSVLSTRKEKPYSLRDCGDCLLTVTFRLFLRQILSQQGNRRVDSWILFLALHSCCASWGLPSLDSWTRGRSYCCNSCSRPCW